MTIPTLEETRRMLVEDGDFETLAELNRVIAERERERQGIAKSLRGWIESLHPRDWHGRFRRKGGGASVRSVPSDEEPIYVGDDVDRAAELLAQGKRVELDQPRTASTLTRKLAKLVHEAEAAGENAPDYDLCRVTVAHTNLFCAESKGIPRVEMPQLKGIAAPGSKADKLDTADRRGETDLSEHFLRHLESLGYKVTETTVPAADLRATQRELDGAKVSGMMHFLRHGGRIEGPPIWTTSDDYVVDGHHRWAVLVAIDAEDNELGNVPIVVRSVDAPITEVLPLALAFAEDWGLPQVSATAGRALAKFDWNPFDHPRDALGRFIHAAEHGGQEVLPGMPPRGEEGPLRTWERRNRRTGRIEPDLGDLEPLPHRRARKGPRRHLRHPHIVTGYGNFEHDAKLRAQIDGAVNDVLSKFPEITERSESGQRLTEVTALSALPEAERDQIVNSAMIELGRQGGGDGVHALFQAVTRHDRLTRESRIIINDLHASEYPGLGAYEELVHGQGIETILDPFPPLCPAGRDLRGTLTHELGHAVARHHEVEDWLLEEPMLRAGLVLKKPDPTQLSTRPLMRFSGYATTSWGEAFAEMFNMLHRPDPWDDSKIPKTEQREIMEQLENFRTEMNETMGKVVI